MVITPPKAPFDGKNSKASMRGRQIFLINCKSKVSLLVSCKQIISQFDSAIFSPIASYFLSEFRPLTFQQRIFHDLKLFVLAIGTCEDQYKMANMH